MLGTFGEDVKVFRGRLQASRRLCYIAIAKDAIFLTIIVTLLESVPSPTACSSWGRPHNRVRAAKTLYRRERRERGDKRIRFLRAKREELSVLGALCDANILFAVCTTVASIRIGLWKVELQLEGAAQRTKG